MKGDRTLIILALVVLIVGGICGFAIHGWTTAPCPEYVATPQSETHAIDSAARARDPRAGRASITRRATAAARSSRPVTRTRRARFTRYTLPAAISSRARR